MKKSVVLLVTGMMSITMAGCSNAKKSVETVVSPMPAVTSQPTIEATSTPTPSLTPTLTPTPAPLDRIVAFNEDIYSEKFNTEDNILYLTINTTYPILNGSSDVVNKINKKLMQIKEDYIEYAKGMSDYILEDPSYTTDEYFFPSDFTQTYLIAYNQDGILNIILDGYDYTGGAHGMPSKISYIYDLNTGEELTLSDFLAVDEVTFHDRVYQDFEKQYNTNPENFFEGDSLTFMNEGISLKMKFHLGKDGITFYFYPYEVSFYAAGFIETTIPWSDPIFKQ